MDDAIWSTTLAHARYSGTFSDRFPTNDDIEAVDAKRNQDLNVRPRR